MRVLQAINLDGLVPLAPRIFELFDYNHDGWIDLREVVCGFSLLRTSRDEDALQLCFKVRRTALVSSARFRQACCYQWTV